MRPHVFLQLVCVVALVHRSRVCVLNYEIDVLEFVVKFYHDVVRFAIFLNIVRGIYRRVFDPLLFIAPFPFLPGQAEMLHFLTG